MNYSQTLDFLFGQLPMYQRIGAAAYKSDLNNTIEICRILGDPQDAVKCIHIAGTNGKGSVSHMLSSVLQEAGFKTGLYTSPHLKDFRERIRINGEMIPREYVTKFVRDNLDGLGHIKPSFFEYTFGMAMAYFALEKVDIAVLETGMGGRLDSTNVVKPLLTVITNIGMDHTQFLGDTMEKIALEKAGIIKTGVPLIIGETQPETESVFRDAAHLKNAPVFFADKEYRLNDIQLSEYGEGGYHFYAEGKHQAGSNHMEIPFRAKYQLKNVVTVLTALARLRGTGFEVSDSQTKQGLLRVIENTGIAGRWHILNKSPLTICDTGHNVDGLREVVDEIGYMKFNTLHFVLGAVDDKQLDGMLQLLPKGAIYYFCKADIPRGLDPEKLKQIAVNFHLMGQTYPDVRAAYESALKNAAADDLVFVGGSTFVVAEVL